MSVISRLWPINSLQRHYGCCSQLTPLQALEKSCDGVPARYFLARLPFRFVRLRPARLPCGKTRGNELHHHCLATRLPPCETAVRMVIFHTSAVAISLRVNEWL